VDAGLPVRWITRVAADPASANVAYAALSGYKVGETLPRLFRTTDVGATWTDISVGLPDAPVNDVVPDPLDPSRLFVATDVGVYATADLGASWHEMGVGLPIGVVADLELHEGTRSLVAGTHGRSSYRIDVDAVVGAPGVAAVAAGAGRLHLEPPSPNPFRRAATLAFSLPRAGLVRVAVFDVGGRLVRELWAGERAAGRHELTWDGRDAAGRAVASGVYLARVSARGEERVARIVRRS
jgi:photosystem II stability/assembly factor-like uncharacterized protein